MESTIGGDSMERRGTGDIVLIGDARSYHAMDWFRSIQRVCPSRRVAFVTDLVESEGHTRLVASSDDVIGLHRIDRLLFRNQSSLGKTWRNLVKLLALPLQARRLRTIAGNIPHAVFHAHTTYYMVLCWIARIEFVGTPLGSEILLRSRGSGPYRFFAVKSLRAASNITVDSANMQEAVLRMSGRNAVVIQNGIETGAILKAARESPDRARTLSLRAIHPNYRIEEILSARARSRADVPLTFIYPFYESSYLSRIRTMILPEDSDLGRIARHDMYRVMAATRLAVSIPVSDSSPRTVYESIFCGCCVAVTYAQWIEGLPACMRERVHLVDLASETWLDDAIERAASVTRRPYVPSDEAIELFDQDRSMAAVARLFYQ